MLVAENKSTSAKNDNKTHNKINDSKNPFDYPKSKRDEKWYWRHILQERRLHQKDYIQAIMRNNCDLNTLDKKNNCHTRKEFRITNTLKFGCVLHDLMYSLARDYHSQLPSYSFCNKHSSLCTSNANFNKYHKIGEWSFKDIGISFGNSCHSPLPLKIAFGQNHNNIKNEMILIDIWRYGDGVFAKKFRPGLYNYDGEVVKNQKLQNQKLGCWDVAKAFFVLKKDQVIMSIKDDFYLQFILHSDQNKSIDNIDNIVGGVGLISCKYIHSVINYLTNNDNDRNSIINCLLLRTNENTVDEVLANSKVVLFSKSLSSHNIFLNKMQIMKMANNNNDNNNMKINNMNDVNNVNNINYMNNVNDVRNMNHKNDKINVNNANYVNSSNTMERSCNRPYTNNLNDMNNTNNIKNMYHMHNMNNIQNTCNMNNLNASNVNNGNNVNVVNRINNVHANDTRYIKNMNNVYHMNCLNDNYMNSLNNGNHVGNVHDTSNSNNVHNMNDSCNASNVNNVNDWNMSNTSHINNMNENNDQQYISNINDDNYGSIYNTVVTPTMNYMNDSYDDFNVDFNENGSNLNAHNNLHDSSFCPISIPRINDESIDDNTSPYENNCVNNDNSVINGNISENNNHNYPGDNCNHNIMEDTIMHVDDNDECMLCNNNCCNDNCCNDCYCNDNYCNNNYCNDNYCNNNYCNDNYCNNNYCNDNYCNNNYCNNNCCNNNYYNDNCYVDNCYADNCCNECIFGFYTGCQNHLPDNHDT